MGANAVPVQIPMGSEENFTGVIDLVENKAVVWYDDETHGYPIMRLQEIPDEFKDEAEEWRAKLIEAVADADDTLLERYFEDPESITSEDMIR